METFSMTKHNKSQGVALITVLAIVAIVTIIVVNTARNLRREALETTVYKQQALMKNYSLGAEALGIRILEESFKRYKYDARPFPWEEQLKELPADFAKMQLSLQPLDGLFNINFLLKKEPENLLPSDHQGDKTNQQKAFNLMFIKLLTSLKLNEELARVIEDWINPFSANAEFTDSNYNTLTPPYQMSHQALIDQSELTLLKGFDADNLEKLAKYITVLPYNSGLNVNLMDEQLFKIIYGDHIARTPTTIFKDIKEFQTSINNANPIIANFPQEKLIVQSNYFLLQGHIEELEGDAEFFFQILFYRDKKGKVTSLWRNYSNPIKIRPLLDPQMQNVKGSNE